jgi:2,3-dihydroxybenzoate-AMP ligase
MKPDTQLSSHSSTTPSPSSSTLATDCPGWPPDSVDRYRHLGYWQNQTFGAMLRQQAQRYGKRTALVGGEQRWSYAQLDQQADRLAKGFEALGVVTGDRVVVQLPNIPEFFAVFFGLSRLGALPVLALPAHRQVEIEVFFRQTDAVAYVICERDWNFDYRTLARSLYPQIPSLRHVIVVGEAQEFVSLDLLSQPQADPDSHQLGSDAVNLSRSQAESGDARQDTQAISSSRLAEQVAFFQLSGGSTGIPKLIPRTHADYLYSVRASAQICGLTPHSVYLVALPVAHNFPFSSPGSLGTLYAGGTVVLARHPNPDETFGLIDREQVTITALVPPLVLIWLDAIATRTPNLSSLEVLQVGGAKLASEIARRITPTLGCRLQQVFGMAEGLVCYTRFDDPEELILTTQGRPISPADEIQVVDDHDRPVPIGEVGHLLTRGPYTIRGYYRAPEHNAQAFTPDGFYRTGDRVRLTSSGHLIVEGRAKDQINRGGEKISAEEVESHLLAHPQIHNAAVVAIPDRFLGEGICAFLVPQNDRNHNTPNHNTPNHNTPGVEIEAIKAFLHDRGLAPYKIPDRFEWLTALPQTSAGKVDKKVLRTKFRH